MDILNKNINISLITLITSFILCIIISVLAFILWSKVKNFIKKLGFLFFQVVQLIFYWIIANFRIIWFFILFIWVFNYCNNHWEQVINFQPISGNSVLFILLVFLSIFPFISNVKGPGIEAMFYNVFKVEEAETKLKQKADSLKNNNNNEDAEKEIARLSEELNNIIHGGKQNNE